MDLDPQIFFSNVTKSLQDPENGPSESLRLLDSFNRSLIEEQLDAELLDVYMPYFYHTSNSLLNFVDKSWKLKPFKKPCLKALEILYAILNNFYSRLSEKDILSLYTLASSIIKSLAEAQIKTKMFDLVKRSLEKSEGCVDVHALPVYKDLCKSLVFSLKQKTSDTVRDKEMALAGYLAKKFSFIIEDHKHLKQILWYNFEVHCSIQKKTSHYAVSGFYTGFADFLESFPLNPTEDKKNVEKLYVHIKHLVVINDRLKLGNRAAMTFFATYTSLFKEHLLKDYQFWHQKLLIWLQLGLDEKKVGSTALRSFYQTVSKVLEEKNDEGCKDIVQYFITYCKTVLNNKDSTNYEKRSAIFCLREFSSVSHKYLDPNEVSEIFLVIMQIFENTFMQDYNPQNEECEYLPDYIQTVANFMRFKEFTASQFYCLQKGVISMIKSFHKLPYLYHGLVIDSLVLTLFYLKKTHYFDTFLENVVYQGVVWSCSHQHVAAEAYTDQSAQKLVTVKNYYHLWRGVLNLTSNRQYDRYEYYLDDRKFILQRVINELIKSLMILVNKLNVSVSLKDEHNVVTVLEKAYKVEEINDYAIFLNVVDFYEDIFDKIEPKMFTKCVTKMIDHLISKCLKYPLISGFYKLLSFCLKISRNLTLFNNESGRQDIINCRETLTSFLTILLNKMAEFKDDLLISCLRVLLETPVEIIEPMLPSCVVPFINIFEVGRSYLPLAEMGIDTLEYWQENISPDTLDPLLSKIIPCLDSFLRSKFLKGYASKSNEKRRKTVQVIKKRKVLEELEPELVKLQRKMLCFIGRQSLKNCQNFIFSDGSFVNNLITGQGSHLKLTLPYEDLQLDMYLDTFLPRIIELALYSSDRKTRIISCELLQACVMVFLGRAKQMSTAGLGELNNMLKTLAMPLLQLGCDVDQVVRQIFEPLFCQLIHWYTSPTQARGAHSAIIIEALMEGITHPSNSSLKDFSGRCINEFVRWTLKHQNLNPESSIKVLVKNIRFFSTHPDSAKKLGAALIFNSVYRELREDEKFIDIFWIEILHIFVLSLDSITDFEETTTINQIKYALANVQRVIIEKPSVFRKINEKRRVPNDLNNGVLTDVSIWLINQTSSNSKHCRQACMELFVNITPLSSTNRLHLHDFVIEHLDTTVSSLYDSKLINFDSLHQKSYYDCASLLNYLRNLLCCLDGYKFIVQNNLETINFDEIVFNEAQIFLEKLQTADLVASLNLIQRKSWNFTVLDKDMFVRLKTACILSILKLYNALIHNELLCDKSEKLWTDNFWKLVTNTVYYPQDLGLNDIITEYSDIVFILLNNIAKKLRKTSVESFVNVLQDSIEQFSTINIEKNTSLRERNLLKGMIMLSDTSLGQKMELSIQTNILLEGFIANFYRNAVDDVIFVNQVPDTTVSHLLFLFKFMLNEKNNLSRLFEKLLLSGYYVQSIDMVKKKHAGLFFTSTFSEALVPAIIKHFDTFLRLGLSKSKSITLDIIIFILGYIIKEQAEKNAYKDLMDTLLMYWGDFAEFFNTSHDTLELGVEFLTLFVQISDAGSYDMQDWLVDCLIRGKSNNHIEIFGLLARIAGNDISEKQSNDLKTAFTILDEKIYTQTSNQDVISNDFNKLLTFLPVVKSLDIFEYLINTYLKITPTVNISYLLSKCIHHLDADIQGGFLEKVYELGTIKLATDILPPLFWNCDLDVFEQFFIQNIENILQKFEEGDPELAIVNFILVEVLFLRIPIGSAERKNCGICIASKRTKLLPDLLKYALDAFKNNQKQDDLTRRYKCHAYNALASMVSNSVKKINFYEKLFIRQADNDDVDILWHGIVNIEANYDFPREFDTLPAQKRILVNIRDELRQHRHKTGNMSKTLQYIESQRLFNSSLSEDVTKFDFSNSVLRSENQGKRKMIENLQVQSEIYLDMTEINKHECMATVCSLIQHIFDNRVCELPTDDDEDAKLPNFLNGIRSLLLNGNTHKNVKIFLVKIIDNMIHIFNRYAKFFLEPLIQFVVDKIAGETINYFVTDVLVIISRWSTEIPILSATEADLASKLLEHFIKNLEKDRQDVFKYNIELLKLIVESWKTHLAPPVSAIIEMLSSDKTSEIAIYVSSVLLVNSLQVWQRGSEHEFLNLMLAQLDSQKRSVYRGCAETLGPLLKNLKADEFVDSVNLRLNGITDFEKYVVCLEGIAITFPQIVNIFHLARLISTFNQVTCAQKIANLKIIHKRLEISTDVLQEINEFKIMRWHDHIEDANLEIQILSLEIVKKCVSEFSKYPDFPKIVTALTRNVYHPNAVFRGCLYDAAIAIYNLHENFTDACKEILIYGLIDADIDNQNKIIDFWSLNSDLPTTVLQRFSYLLSDMYKTKIEDKLLGFSTYFLLVLLRKSDKYDLEIFEHPLEDCDFEEYKLQTSWKLQHPSVVPMFAETLDVGSIESSSSDPDRDLFQLRQTQSNLEFAPTQSYQEQQLSKFTFIESTLGVDPDQLFKDPNSYPLSDKYKMRKRFLKDKTKISINMAHAETYKKIKKGQERVESALEREKKVTIYRSYRRGDFPDIQIDLSAVLKPLQMLALHDNEISKILFLELFKGLSSKIENNTDFLSTISRSIQNIFQTSIQFNRFLFSALLDILLKNKEKITLDPNLIAKVSRESGLGSVGILLIEEYIIAGVEDEGPSTSKRCPGQDTRETIFWVKLAELYKDIEEWDAVRSIFSEKMDCKDTIQKALTFESKSLYREARHIYKDLIQTDLSQNRRDFYYESYFKCFANLCEWEKIPNAIESVVDNENTWKGLWEDDWSKQKLLPWYITSKLKTQLFNQEIQHDFLSNLNDCLTHPKNSEYLTSNFSEELSILWLSQNDIPTAVQYLKTCVKNFLNDWQLMNPMFQSQRYQLLLKLQTVIEIADFTATCNNLTDDIDRSLKTLTERWRRCQNDTTPSVLFSETKLLYRRLFINVIVEKLQKIEGLDLKKQIKDMKVAKLRMDLDLINTAADLGSFYITRKYLKPYMEKENDKLSLAKGTGVVLKTQMMENSSDKVNFLLDAVDVFAQIKNSEALKASTKQFDVLINISRIVSDNNDILTEFREKLAAFTDGIKNSASDIEKHAFKVLKTAVENCNTDSMDTDSDNFDTLKKFKNISDAYIKLAHFIREKGDESLQGDFILFVLRAMRLNSSEARQLFPCILMQNNLSGIYKDTFITEVDNIPTWMFLGWIPQLLANVDSPKIFALSKIILRIAETYPQAIMYPYRLSKENYNFNDGNVASEAKILTDRLDDLLLKDEKIEKFLKALSYVCVPAAILKYWVVKIFKSQNPETIKKYVQAIETEIFEEKCGTGNVANLQGNVFKKIEKYKREFVKFTGKGMTAPKIKELYMRLNGEFVNMLNDKRSNSSMLKDYSPWIANFSANKLNMDLEIPGQYDGQKLPLPQHHVKIAGFCPEVMIMESLRKPMKLTILGMNTKEYPFLLKFGEDIRQDQRIQQLFCLMNGFLRNDNSCSSNGLEILTYQVIPLTSNLGLIQWIDHTRPLSDFLKKSLKNDRELKQYDAIREEYDKKLKIDNRNCFNSYGKAAVNVNKERIADIYSTLVRKVSSNILRTSFWSLSTSTENYIALRNNFIKTYSVICATHWILGIGDRHLNNSLISLRNGKVLGIDFGHAFGTATQIQPVPELVPFRLTPHLVNLMEPLKERGPFREYMIHCLRCLRDKNPSLLATMNVFIQEPSLDWLEHSGVTDDGESSDVNQSDSWYPLVKIEQARRKLAGANSVDIMMQELTDGCRNEAYTQAYLRHVKGETGVNFRSDLIGRADLSVEEQVDCLIDHATDYNLLGRMYGGWSPWV